MGHSGDTISAWEWDSVLLLANPTLDYSTNPSRSTYQTLSSLEDGVNFSVGQSWADLDHLQTTPTSHSEAPITTGPQSSSTLERTASGFESIGDPRLDCPNFLAGRVPCACTDNEDEDDGGSRGKRPKVSARCQVPACRTDLARLKGYHQRHRVCLRCANATTVVLHELAHRYCQQCGKFHVLSDFDEGKRSCRRKLERHNNRRRRKVQESGEDTGTVTVETDSRSPLEETLEDGKSNGEERPISESKEVEQTVVIQNFKESLLPLEKSETTDSAHVSLRDGLVDVLASKLKDGLEAASVPTDMHHYAHERILPPVESAQLWESSARPCSDASGRMAGVGVHKGRVDEDSLLALLLEDSPTRVDTHSSALASNIPPRPLNKQNTYTSSCPTGRISFKLYDWNPADFPRNLRQQILEWLSNMPVDLEGYIRSGCTILTLFIAMPQPMWDKLNADWAGAVTKLVQTPQTTGGFWEKGHFNAKLGKQTVHFENGKEVIRSGGKENCMPCMPVLHSVEPLCIKAGEESELTITGHNLLQHNTRLLVSFGGKYVDAYITEATSISKQEDEWQIVVPALNPGQLGPVFIEVENEGRTSNQVVVLVGEERFCTELKILEPESYFDAQDQLYDLGWMLREAPCKEDASCCRLRQLYQHAMGCGWSRVADSVLKVAKRAGVFYTLNGDTEKIPTLDWRNCLWEDEGYKHQGLTSVFVVRQINQSHLLPVLANSVKDGNEDTHMLVRIGVSGVEDMAVPLLPKRGLRWMCRQTWGKSAHHLLLAAASVTAACAGICLVVQHPNEVVQLSTSIRQCLWGQ